MNNLDLINKIRNIVENACKSDKNIFGYGICTHHIVSVVDNALLLAERLGADREIV
jgi:HD superfamily phosphodiesterase